MILKPHVGSIINHIELIVSQNISKKTLPAKPLKILARYFIIMRLLSILS